jgi:hypothetical protein
MMVHLEYLHRSYAAMPTPAHKLQLYTVTILPSNPTQLSRSLIGFDQHLGEVRDLLSAANFLNEKRHLDDVEVLAVEVVDLLEVLLLHLAAAVALGARVRGAGEEQLVDDDGAGVDFVVAELLDHALGFVEGEELGDHDGDEAVRLDG